MELTEMLLINVILVILIVNSRCAAIGDADGTGRTLFNKKRNTVSTDSEILSRRRRYPDAENVAGNPELSYIYTPQEFLKSFRPPDITDVYEFFRDLYLEAFPLEEPSLKVTEKKLEELGLEFELSKCSFPRIKMIDLYEELGIPPTIVISPPAANVSRCGTNSGCCPKGETCHHTGDNFKNKTITVLYVDGSNISVKQYNVLEHGRCTCTTLTPSCKKKCTSLFHQDNNCECIECKDDKKNRCEKLMRGNRDLADMDVQCVENDHCMEPACNDNLHYSRANKTCIY